jgi:hypothetical protein
MYPSRNGFQNRTLSYLFSSIVFLLCAESTIPTSAPTAKNNEPMARLYGGIIGLSICCSILIIFFCYFYPRTASHHRVKGVDEDQVQRYQMAYFHQISHENHFIMPEKCEHNQTKGLQDDSPDVEFDKDHHRRVDLNQEEAPEPLCKDLR